MIEYNINRFRFPSISTSELKTLPVELRNEFTLNTNDYKGILTESGILGYARLVINLLFLKPGTYPNSPEMGIDIQQYSFDIMDDELLSDIENDIRTQMSIYLPGNIDIDIFVEMIQPNDSLKKILGIAFRVNADENDVTQFFIFVNDDNGHKKSHVVVP